MRVGLLHTVPALAPLFDGLLRDRRSGLQTVHLVDASLLSDAIAAGEAGTDEQTRVEAHLAALSTAGARAVLVTCSSLGDVTERAAEATGIAVVRVDAAMAGEAVRRARAAGAAAGRDGRIVVLATVTATLGPTTRLLEREAADRAGVAVQARLVADAAEARAAGDLARHDGLVAAAVADADADVVVLAQASMADAAGDDPRVLTSPASGADAFVRALPAP